MDPALAGANEQKPLLGGDPWGFSRPAANAVERTRAGRQRRHCPARPVVGGAGVSAGAAETAGAAGATTRWASFFSISVGQSLESRGNGHNNPLWQLVVPLVSIAAVAAVGGAVVTVLVPASKGVR